MEKWRKLTLCAVSLFFLMFFVIGWVQSSIKSDGTNYQTVVGTGPDKWASVWLIRSHLNPEPVDIKQAVADLRSDAVSFDTDGAVLTRTGTSTTYTAFLGAHEITDPVAVKLGKIIHDIEINAWNPNREIESLQVENGFRQMQLAYGREQVSQACYMIFFMRVAEAIKRAGISLESDASEFIPDESCLTQTDQLVENFKGQGNNTQVAELDLPTVLATMESKKQLVFIDTREAFEFREGHIPGAINLTLRQIESLDENSTVMQSLVDADLVIAYCVKDFRGFEAARKLRKLGVNAAIMNPYGIKGWRNAGLPIVGSRGLSEPAALTAMQSILLDQKLGKDGTAKQGTI